MKDIEFTLGSQLYEFDFHELNRDLRQINTYLLAVDKYLNERRMLSFKISSISMNSPLRLKVSPIPYLNDPAEDSGPDITGQAIDLLHQFVTNHDVPTDAPNELVDAFTELGKIAKRSGIFEIGSGDERFSISEEQANNVIELEKIVHYYVGSVTGHVKKIGIVKNGTLSVHPPHHYSPVTVHFPVKEVDRFEGTFNHYATFSGTLKKVGPRRHGSDMVEVSHIEVHDLKNMPSLRDLKGALPGASQVEW